MSDSSTQGIKTVLHPVSDLAAAKAVYTALLGVARRPVRSGLAALGVAAAIAALIVAVSMAVICAPKKLAWLSSSAR